MSFIFRRRFIFWELSRLVMNRETRCKKEEVPSDRFDVRRQLFIAAVGSQTLSQLVNGGCGQHALVISAHVRRTRQSVGPHG